MVSETSRRTVRDGDTAAFRLGAAKARPIPANSTGEAGDGETMVTPTLSTAGQRVLADRNTA
jgi:hypothetical protein